MKSPLTPMRRLSRSLILLLGVGTMMLAGCTSRSHSAAALGTATDLQGVWKIWATQDGQVETGPAAMFLAVTGTTIAGPDIGGSVSGSNFEFIANVMTGMAAAEGTLTSATTASGTFVITKTTGPSVKGTFRMEKFSPTGFFSVTGMILGESITHRSDTAVGIRKFLDPAFSQMIEAEVATGSAALSFELDFLPDNLAVGTLPVGWAPNEVGIAVEFSTGANSARVLATSGTLDVTRYDASGFAATFTLKLESGDTVTGILDVEFNLNALHPFGA